MNIRLAPVILTRLPDQTETEYVLPPITLWPLGTITSAHVLPSSLDMDRFVTAVGVAAGRVRGVAGRYGRRRKGEEFEYFIKLQDSPIPITHVSGPEVPVLATNVDVVRTDLAPFIDNVDLANQLNDDATPLLKIKITEHTSRRTVVGICWAHILGDGASFNLFTTILSSVYAHLACEALSTLDLPTPTTTHISFTSPSPALTERYAIPQTEPLSIAEGSRLYGEGMQGETVVFRLSVDEAARLKAKAGGEVEARGWISTQDALSAWFVELLREASGEDICTITNSINYRSFPIGLTSLFLIGNVAQMLATPIPSPTSPADRSLVRTAHALRADLIALRADPQRTYDWLSVCGDRLGRAANKGQMMCVLPRKGDVFVNSNLKYEWNVPFGFPLGTTSYHTGFSGHHLLRVFQPNPNSMSFDPLARGAAELIFDVDAGLRDKILEVMEADRLSGWERYN